ASNGQEKLNQWAGIANFKEYGFRGYDSRIARFVSVDPITSQYPWYSPYQIAGNTPIQAIDLDGLEPMKAGTVSKVAYMNNSNATVVVSEVTLKVQVINMSSTKTEHLNLSNVRAYINEFGNQLNGVHTAEITTAYGLNKDGKPVPLGGNYLINATYSTK